MNEDADRTIRVSRSLRPSDLGICLDCVRADAVYDGLCLDCAEFRHGLDNAGPAGAE